MTIDSKSNNKKDACFKYRLRCLSCFRPEKHCLCKYTNPIDTNSKFIILIHPKELKRERVGTGRITNLQLNNSMMISGIDFTNNSLVNSHINNSENNCFLLYPTENSIKLDLKSSKSFFSNGKMNVFFILDSTWSGAKKMLKLSKNLQALKTVSFDNKLKSKFLFKQQPYPECLSTIESAKAVIDRLVVLGIENTDTGSLLKPFEELIKKQVESQLNPPPGSYRSVTVSPIDNKNNYKKGNIRKVFFDSSRKN